MTPTPRRADGAPEIGIVCGLAAERRALGRLLDDPRIAVAISGARPAEAEAAAARLVAAGCRLLVSWGIAGALAPGLATGDLVMPARVVSEDGGSWPIALPAPLPAGARRIERLLGVEAVVLGIGEKKALGAASGAAAVDMESHRVARVAAAAGLPSLAWRAISDPAGRALPVSAKHAVTRRGTPALGPVILGLARRPADLWALIAAGRDSRQALEALAASVPALEAALRPVEGAGR